MPNVRPPRTNKEAGTTVSDAVLDLNEADFPAGFIAIGAIAAGHGAVSGIAVRSDGALLTVTHYGDDSVSLIGTADGAPRLTVTDVDEPAAVAMAGNRAYVSSVSTAHDEILAFDTDSERIVATYPVEFGITDLVVSPNGRFVYTGRTGEDGAGVAILDTSTGKQTYVGIAASTVGCVRVSPDGRRLYVAANGASTAELVTIDTQRYRVVGTVEIGSPIRDIALSPDGATAYVGSCGSDFGTVLDIVDARNPAINATYKIGDAAGLTRPADREPCRRPGLPGRRSARHGVVDRDPKRSRQHHGRRPAVVCGGESGRQAALHRRLRRHRHRAGDLRSSRAGRRTDVGRRTDRPARVGVLRPADARADAGLGAASPQRRLAGRAMIATRAAVWRAGPGSQAESKAVHRCTAPCRTFRLTITAIMRHAGSVHGARTVTTATGDGYRHSTYAANSVSRRPSWRTRCGAWVSPATSGSPRSCGTTPNTWRPTWRCRRWARCCTPSTSGCSPSRSPTSPTKPKTRSCWSTCRWPSVLAPVLADLETVHTVIAVGEGDTAAAGGIGQDRAALRRRDRRRVDRVRLAATSTRTPRPQCATPAAPPETPKALSTAIVRAYLHTMATCTSNGIGVGSSDSVLPIVPMFHANAWGLPYAALMAGADLVLPDRHLDAESLIDMIENAAAHRGRRRADHLERRHALPREGPRPRHVVAAPGAPAAARRCRCR